MGTMQLQSLARDCLYLNWALPLEQAPVLPSPLRYETHRTPDGNEHVFATALLYRLSGLRLQALPLLRVGYPQMTLRIYVFDGTDTPSALFLRVLVPAWVVPGSHLFGRQVAVAASFDYPSSPIEPGEDSRRWCVERGGRRLQVSVRQASPGVGAGPKLGSWEQTVGYFRQRRNAYALRQGKLRSITTSRPALAVWPLAVEVESADLLAHSLLASGQEADFPELHSAWLCPEVPFTFEIGRAFEVHLPARRVTAAEGC